MSTAPFSGGPLQQSDLLGIWESVMDDGYTQPFVQAGDGKGMEAWNQSFAQLVRASSAVDVSMQSLFILPWSGQTNPHASGPNQATVTLSISRTGLVHQPLVLGAGFTWVDEVAQDWSATGTQNVVTGLRYSLSTDVVFEPGESGPLTVTATAERPGYGYNNPLPGSINAFENVGTGYGNDLATLALGTAGKFVAVVLLMLQLTSSAGTFPIQTVPRFFQVINPFLPMTYVVTGLRQAISGGDTTRVLWCALILLGYAVGAIALTTLAARRRRRWTMDRLKPVLAL